MATITIPSPSVILSSSPISEPILPLEARTSQASQRRRSQGRRTAAAPGTTIIPSQRKRQRQKEKRTVTFKPKQSKSRNGCVTCKKKRLKCDETKPSCQHCLRRGVECGGYQKVYQWRPFEESSLNNRIVPPPRAQRNSTTSTVSMEIPQATSPTTSDASLNTTDMEFGPESVSSNESNPIIEGAQDYYDLMPSNLAQEPILEASFSSSVSNFFEIPFQTDELPYRPGAFSEPCSAAEIPSCRLEDISSNEFLAFQSSCSGLSPKLKCLHLAGFDPDTGSPDLEMLPELLPDQSPETEQCNSSDSLEKMEVIQRLPQFANEESWSAELSPRRFFNAGTRDCRFAPFYVHPRLQTGSTEFIMSRFDRDTCGILSIKNGQSENPWRAHLGPLIVAEPALLNAIAAMTTFHTSKGEPNLRSIGLEYMNRSIRLLRNRVSYMRPDTALATTLALAFSESWDVHISTGQKHLQAAKIFIQCALAENTLRSPEDLARLKFLCNTFTYMDVIARLTSVDADENNDFEYLISPIPSPFGSMASAEIDPLMGCASTLFPLIGRVANLCRRARLSKVNSVLLIDQATKLKGQVEQWDSGTSFENPEDPSSGIQDALQTAEAYRYATLLYLHQAVPEVPFRMTSAQLALKVLKYLATVEPRSGLVIVQIYPLLAAGCEVTEEDDPGTRDWVRNRWQRMTQRMLIGNVDRCCEVMEEVWRRRDDHVARKEAARRGKENQRRSMGMPHIDVCKGMSEAFSFEDVFSGHSSLAEAMKRESHHQGLSGRSMHTNGESRLVVAPSQRRNSEPMAKKMEFEYTVRGRLHWVGVMNDWKWEVLLG